MTADTGRIAGTAWKAYVSCVCTGGTPAERQWSFDAAMRAERKLWAVDRALEKRVERDHKRKQAEAAHP